jgi:diguanylate cyclase (GGDEF)-like protein
VFGNSKKTIGVFISQINDEYQDTLVRGIITKAKALDYNVAFFTNFGGFGQVNYDMGEAKIAELPNYDGLDGIIFVPDVMSIDNLEEQYKLIFKNRSHCPIVSIRKEIKDYYNVLIDDCTVLDEIITHFIEDHGFTRLNFLSGPKDFPDTDKRLQSYKKILTEHKIPVEEDRIYYGDLWKYAGFNAVEHWLNSDLERPQAIICANDNMALTILRALYINGISVPDQIAVAGCDDIEDAAEYSPSLTTVRMPVFEMGEEAVDKIHKHHLSIEQPKASYLKTITMYRASCGCKRNWYHESNNRRRNHINVRETLKSEITRNALMSADLTGLTRLEDISDKMQLYVYQNDNFADFCMCLFNNWDMYHSKEEEENTDVDKELMMEIGIRNKVVYTKIKFSRDDLLPPLFSQDSPMIYFFALLHHQEHLFGYVGISFSRIQTYMRTFQAWLINVSNALENVRIHGELNRLVYKLEDMSIRDELTELYNRRVINTLGKKYLKQCLTHKSYLMVFTADMDSLKYINDKYGHSRGDIALRTIANALKYAADDDEICIRLGGDEFMALGMEYDEIKMAKFVKRFIGELDKFNKKHAYDFCVYVSYGCNLFLPDEKTTIESCLSSADALMYLQKSEKASKNIKANLLY